MTGREAAARRIVRSARVATLATAEAGQPHAALVTVACLPDFSVALLLSGLSLHTRHLRGDGRCSLLCTGEAAGGEAAGGEAAGGEAAGSDAAGGGLFNPQTLPRVSLGCMARPDASAELRRRYLDWHPYADAYAALADFQVWRLSPVRAHVVGGFAQAWSCAAEELAPPADVVARVAAAEAAMVADYNDGHAGGLRAVGRAWGGRDGDWRLLAIDPDGCSLMADEAAAWAPWPHGVVDAAGVRLAMAALVRAAGGR